jgi:tRNA(fMet)-specific endonuclease VapC
VYLLDTDSVSNYLDKRRGHAALRARVAAEPPQNIWISIITVEEIVQGVLGLLHKARNHPRNADKIILFGALLESTLRDLMTFQILPYDRSAEESFGAIPANIKRRHSQDCHIAAIAISRGFIVVTSNTRHFADIPGVTCEDWTLEEDP